MKSIAVIGIIPERRFGRRLFLALGLFLSIMATTFQVSGQSSHRESVLLLPVTIHLDESYAGFSQSDMRALQFFTLLGKTYPEFRTLPDSVTLYMNVVFVGYIGAIMPIFGLEVDSVFVSGSPQIKGFPLNLAFRPGSFQITTRCSNTSLLLRQGQQFHCRGVELEQVVEDLNKNGIEPVFEEYLVTEIDSLIMGIREYDVRLEYILNFTAAIRAADWSDDDSFIQNENLLRDCQSRMYYLSPRANAMALVIPDHDPRNYVAAYTALEELVEEARAKHEDNRNGIYLRFYKRGLEALGNGDTLTAEGLFRKSRTLKPDFGPAWLQMAFIADRSSRTESAISLIERGIMIQSNDPGLQQAFSELAGSIYIREKALGHDYTADFDFHNAYLHLEWALHLCNSIRSLECDGILLEDLHILRERQYHNMLDEVTLLLAAGFIGQAEGILNEAEKYRAVFSKFVDDTGRAVVLCREIGHGYIELARLSARHGNEAMCSSLLLSAMSAASRPKSYQTIGVTHKDSIMIGRALSGGRLERARADMEPGDFGLALTRLDSNLRGLAAVHPDPYAERYRDSLRNSAAQWHLKLARLSKDDPFLSLRHLEKAMTLSSVARDPMLEFEVPREASVQLLDTILSGNTDPDSAVLLFRKSMEISMDYGFIADPGMRKLRQKAAGAFMVPGCLREYRKYESGLAEVYSMLKFNRFREAHTSLLAILGMAESMSSCGIPLSEGEALVSITAAASRYMSTMQSARTCLQQGFTSCFLDQYFSAEMIVNENPEIDTIVNHTYLAEFFLYIASPDFIIEAACPDPPYLRYAEIAPVALQAAAFRNMPIRSTRKAQITYADYLCRTGIQTVPDPAILSDDYFRVFRGRFGRCRRK